MKLTKEQIQIIKEYINSKKINYVDIQIEILDHISSDVELIMSDTHIHFKSAFDQVKEKWKSNFEFRSSFLLGIFYEKPSIFLKRCKKIYKPYSLKGFASIFITVFVFSFMQKHLFQNSLFINKIFTNGSLGLSFVYFGLVLYWYFKIKKTHLKTVFSFLYNTQIFPNLIIVGLMFNSIKNKSFSEFNTFEFVFLSALLITLYQGYIFYTKHLKEVSDFKKYQLK